VFYQHNTRTRSATRMSSLSSASNSTSVLTLMVISMWEMVQSSESAAGALSEAAAVLTDLIACPSESRPVVGMGRRARDSQIQAPIDIPPTNSRPFLHPSRRRPHPRPVPKRGPKGLKGPSYPLYGPRNKPLSLPQPRAPNAEISLRPEVFSNVPDPPMDRILYSYPLFFPAILVTFTPFLD
jgi:hypothetical protein